MIEAGTDCLLELQGEVGSGFLVEAVFLAMVGASPTFRHSVYACSNHTDGEECD